MAKVQKGCRAIDKQYKIFIICMNWPVLSPLHNRRRHFDALFFVNLFSGPKCCRSTLETFGLRVPTGNIRNLTIFTCFLATADVLGANAPFRHIDIFNNSCLNVNNLKWHNFSFSVFFCPVFSHCCVCLYRADSVIGHSLLRSASKQRIILLLFLVIPHLCLFVCSFAFLFFLQCLSVIRLRLYILYTYLCVHNVIVSTLCCVCNWLVAVDSTHK
jgi:hypothetical protein